MTGAVDWHYLDAGHYRGTYHDHILEIKRNPDSIDRRRYIGLVDGVPLPQAGWTVPQMKTKLIRYIERQPATVIAAAGDLHDQAVVIYEPPPPAAPAAPAEGFIEMHYVIRGKMRVRDFAAGWDHLTSTVEMLREWGPAEGEAKPPAKIKF